MTDDCAIIVSSCDAYRDAWPPFFALLFKYWPDCPWPIYLISEREVFTDARVQALILGTDRKWADNLAAALEQIPATFVLYLQDDYFLDQPVSTAKLQAILAWLAAAPAVGYLRLWGSPEPDEAFPASIPGLGLIAPGAAYRVSLQAALWRKDLLRSLLRSGESGWEMEQAGSQRSDDRPEKFLSFTRATSPLHYREAIKKGRWRRGVATFLRQEGVAFPTGERRTIAWTDGLRRFGRAILTLTPVRGLSGWLKNLRKKVR